MISTPTKKTCKKTLNVGRCEQVYDMIVHDCVRLYIYELTAAAVLACQCHHPQHSTMFMYGRLLCTSGTQRMQIQFNLYTYSQME